VAQPGIINGGRDAEDVEGVALASCLIYAKTLSAPISWKSGIHFGARLGEFFYWTGCFENKGTFRQYTAQIYL